MTLLHDAGMIHGDLSANNVLLTAAANRRRFTVAVSDFGLSRISVDADGHMTATVGTVGGLQKGSRGHGAWAAGQQDKGRALAAGIFCCEASGAATPCRSHTSRPSCCGRAT